ncbi:hypothetical protein [Butyrivibrio sp. MC2021]|uniref:hypothetical protein n=1 Tax=Butyrivibrio sp. MC2021 TaxID=1408306 RepID=UPI00047D03F7|nr:hypothetical protein [Butyrivibrio sp. MC2021]
MEKRFREYIRHFEKLDYDVLSEEEIRAERQGIQLEISMLHQDMVRCLIAVMGLLICACIFLSAALGTASWVHYICAAVMALATAFLSLSYRKLGDIVKKLSGYADKLAQIRV